MVRAAPHERFSSEVVLTSTQVREYALAVGDTNPVHQGVAFAAASRFGRVIASGTHTTALLLALTASYFARKGAMLGLDFWVCFRRPVFADESNRLEWLVVRVTRNDRLGGDVVELRGRITNQAGATLLGAKGRILVTDRI